MSSHRRKGKLSLHGRRSLLAGLAALLAAPVLTACQFQPLYGTSRNGLDMRRALRDIDIGPIPGRVGQKLRNELIFKTGNSGAPAASQYRLEIVIREWETGILVEQTGDARGVQYNLEATFKLFRIKGKDELLTGRSVSRAAFDKFDSTYTNVRARRDAEDRAARFVADGIRTRISAFLSGTA